MATGSVASYHPRLAFLPQLRVQGLSSSTASSSVLVAVAAAASRCFAGALVAPPSASRHDVGGELGVHRLANSPAVPRNCIMHLDRVVDERTRLPAGDARLLPAGFGILDVVSLRDEELEDYDTEGKRVGLLAYETFLAVSRI